MISTDTGKVARPHVFGLCPSFLHSLHFPYSFQLAILLFRTVGQLLDIAESPREHFPRNILAGILARKLVSWNFG